MPLSKSAQTMGMDEDRRVTDPRPTIMVIDDEPNTIALLQQLFRVSGYQISGETSGTNALRNLPLVKPNLILLDLMMPDMDGWQTYDQIRKISDLPVIVLTAIDQTEYVVRALEMGADDFITKPFYQPELLARVNNILHRRGTSQKVNRFGFSMIDLVLDLDSQEIHYKGKLVQLTGKMFELLHLLARYAPKVVTYETVTKAIWGENSPSAHKRLKYLIYLLRRQFQQIASLEVIKNVEGVGYKLIIEDES